MDDVFVQLYVSNSVGIILSGQEYFYQINYFLNLYILMKHDEKQKYKIILYKSSFIG